MPTRSKKLPANSFPLLNVSPAKLAIAVIVSALLTMALFVIENRRQIETSPIATAALAKPINVTVKLNSGTTPTETTVRCPENETLSQALKNHFPDLVISPSWQYLVNGTELTISPDRFALKSGDVVEINPIPNR